MEEAADLKSLLDDTIVETTWKRRAYPIKILPHVVHSLKAERKLMVGVTAVCLYLGLINVQKKCVGGVETHRLLGFMEQTQLSGRKTNSSPQIFIISQIDVQFKTITAAS